MNGIWVGCSRSGAFDGVARTDDVERVTGRRPIEFSTFVCDHADAWVAVSAGRR